MSKIKLFMTSCLLSLFICGFVSAQTRIAVLPFTPDEKISKAAMSYLTEIFTVEMVNSKKFTVVERARLDAALKEMQMQSGDMFDESSAVELGKMSGAEMVFFGSIFRFGGRELLSIKGMDIKTATLKYAKQEKGGNDIMLEKAVKLMAKQIIEETAGVSGNADESLDTMERLRNKKGDKSVKYNPAETKVLDKYIYGKWGITPDSEEDMTFYYKKHLGAGIALSVAGSVSFLTGLIVLPVLVTQTTEDRRQVYKDGYYQYDEYGNPVYESYTVGNFSCIMAGCILGPILLTAGIVMIACCAYPFSLAKHIASIYRKTTGQKLTFLDRVDVGGGYDWENKEVTVAMAIKL